MHCIGGGMTGEVENVEAGVLYRSINTSQEPLC